MLKGGGVNGIRRTEEIQQEEKVELQDIRRKVKGALAELSLALRVLDKLYGK
jgi:hypothetical protein